MVIERLIAGERVLVEGVWSRIDARGRIEAATALLVGDDGRTLTGRLVDGSHPGRRATPERDLPRPGDEGWRWRAPSGRVYVQVTAGPFRPARSRR